MNIPHQETNPGDQGKATASSALPANLLYQLPSIVDRLEIDALFQRLQPLEVELGSGDGSFLLEYAKAHPERNFIGVERLLGRIRKLDRKGRRLGLTNLRGIRVECAYLTEYLLPPGSVSALHIYFPDPWPKRKHWRHRLIKEGFPQMAAQALAPGATLYLRTDDPPYFSQMLEVFSASPLFEACETPEELQRILTDFEKEFVAQGIQTLRAAYRKRTAG